MPVSVTLELDKRRAKKDGTFPIKILVIVDSQPLRISTGYSVEIKHWNTRSQSVKSACKAYPNVTRVNNLLHKQRGSISDKIILLQDEGKISQLSLQELKRFLTGKQTEAMVLAFGEEIIKELQEAGKIGNSKVYYIMIRSIHTYLKGKDRPLKQITYTWLKKYEAWYLGRGNSINGLGVNMRTLRALYNRAIKRNLVSKDFYPFTKYSIKKESTRKRAISQSDIEKIKTYQPTTLRQERAKDYFLMSFYLMGASFIDLAFLQMKSMQNGRVEYKRRKTGKLHSIKITAPLQDILNKYIEGKTENDYILPVIKSDDVHKQYKNLENDIRRYNKSLKEIGQELGLSATLTSYVARHSFATIAKFKDVPIAVISQALGHSNTETTEIYLSEFDNEVLDRYNEEIVGE